MANPNPNRKGLKKPFTPKIARKLGALGGKKSGEAKREKKLLSQIYAEVIAEENNINGTGKSLKEVVGDVLTGVFSTPAAKVSMLKELREATEGSKLNITGDINIEPAPGLKKRTKANGNKL